MRKSLLGKEFSVVAADLAFGGAEAALAQIAWRSPDAVASPPTPANRLQGLRQAQTAGERHVVIQFDSLPSP